MKKVLLLTVLILLLSSVYLFSAVPCKINYQGRLIKDNVPVDGTKTMVFSIHDSAVGGNELWTSGNVNVEVHNGLFRYVIGTDGGDLSSINWTAGQALYLEVKIEADILTPREEMSAYPYAINSHLLEGETKDYFINTSGETQKKDGGLNIMGNVGIGTTSPGGKLEVAASSGNADIILNRIGTGSTRLFQYGASDNFYIGKVGAGNINLYKYGGGNVPSIGLYGDVIYNAGNVGIGTPSPDAKLEIVKSASGDILNISSASENDGDLVTILNNGNVGIGTTSPGAKLEVAGNFRATGGIEPDYDSGWVWVDRIGAWGLKTLTHNLNYFPRQIQWWFSNGNPGTFIGPLASNTSKDHSGNPLGIWITLTQVKFSIWHDRYVYRMYNASSQAWSNYNNGYYRFLLWK